MILLNDRERLTRAIEVLEGRGEVELVLPELCAIAAAPDSSAARLRCRTSSATSGAQ